MALTAEVPLVASAVAITIVALLRTLPGPRRRWANHLALAAGILAAVAPLLTAPFLQSGRAAGRALWAWSAVGGPTIQASYRLDGIGAIGAAICAAYVVAALFAATRTPRRPPLLVALVVAIGHTTIALAVVDDFIAAILLLSVLAALTTAAALLVVPSPAAARVAAYLAAGVQFFVLGALLITRFGGASLRFLDLRPTAISPGIVLATTLGAALFAGMYPFVPWHYRRARGATEREALRGLIAMPAGVGATLLLLRLLGVTRTDLSTLGVPALDGTLRIVAGIAIVLAVLLVAVRRQVVPGRSIIAGATLLLLTVLYPTIHWSHFVLGAALLTVLYAAAASLAMPEEWTVARYDVALATLWIGLALGTPLAIGAALAIVAADAALAIADSVWLPPHRSHIVLIAGASMLVTGLGALAFGVADVEDPLTVFLALVGIAAIFALHIAHLERRVQVADPPFTLDAASAATAFLATSLLAILVAPALAQGITLTLGRPLPARLADAPVAFMTLAAAAVLVVAAARSMRSLLPDLESLGERLGRLAALADPVPAAMAAYAVVDWTATRTAAALAFLEQRAGVGLATVLIAALLIWAVR